MKSHPFISGTYTGFFNYHAGGDHYPTQLSINFAGGRVTGHGHDQYGPFIVLGSFNAAEGECQWTKTYSPERMIVYRGFSEADGIWGTWEIESVRGGGFQLIRNRSAAATAEHSGGRERGTFRRQ